MNYRNYKLSKIRAAATFLVILIAVFTGCAQNMAAKKDMETPPEPKLITEISTSEDSESFNVLVKGNRVLTYMSVKQLLPLAVLLYFPDTALDNIKTNILPESEIVGSITASELNEKGHKSKIKISLKKDVPYKADSEETGLKISFSRPSKVLSSPILSSPTLPSSGPVEKPVEKKEEKAKKPAWINRIDFSGEEAGKSTIIIGTTRPVEYKTKKASPQLLQLKLLNTRLPDYRKFPLITTRFESAVDRIIPVQTPAMKNTSMLTIELRESVPYFIEQNGNTLLVHFEASSISPMPLKDAKLPAWKKVISQTVHKEEEDEEKIEKKIEIVEEPSVGVATEKHTDEKIALDFYEIDIKNVFRILQAVSGKNFAIDKDVTGKVTLTLDKPVPWNQVLNLVLKMNQLGKVFEGDVIRIATAETLKKEAVFKRDKLALEPLVTAYLSINYASSELDMLPKIKAILTERGRVSADQRTNTIIITDIPNKIDKAREIVTNLDKVTPQVIIEARIVEASTNFSREIGVQWGAARGVQPSANLDTNAMGGAWVTDEDLGAQGTLDQIGVGGNTYGGNMAMNLPIASNAMSIGFNFTKLSGTPFLLNAKLLAMESRGEGKIISSPKIVTLDNKEAAIMQGLQYPIVTPGTDGGPATTKLEDLLLELTVKPHVTPDSRISMVINIKKRDLGNVINSEQSFTKKEATTELLVDDGDTIVIGGIIKTTKSSGETGVPWLSKIPLIGWLFKSTEKIDNKEELLIFITPTIIQLKQRSLQN